VTGRHAAAQEIDTARGRLDATLRMIAQVVQHHIITGPEQPLMPTVPVDIRLIESQPVTPLVTQIRVHVSGEHRPRYFTVEVREGI
jgi:hypothetical protein